MKKIPLTKVAAGAAFLCLLACGDDSSSGSDKGEKEEGSVETVDALDETERGAGGYGHTGIQ